MMEPLTLFGRIVDGVLPTIDGGIMRLKTPSGLLC